jgi:hypothetical protein
LFGLFPALPSSLVRSRKRVPQLVNYDGSSTDAFMEVNEDAEEILTLE